MAKKSIDRTYHISPRSVLKLEGLTNFSGFICGCNEIFPPQFFTIEMQENGGTVANFNQTKLNIRVTSLDCGDKLMNKGLQHALNAEAYPYITIELMKIREDKCNQLTELNDWIKIKALTRLTINGKSNDYWLDITAKKLQDNCFRFTGNKKFCMSDFGVKPPAAMMGIVKVQDEINIILDLEITII